MSRVVQYARAMPTAALPAVQLGQRPRAGYLYTLAAPLLAGLSTIEGVNIGSLNYTGPLWLVCGAAAVFMILLEKALHPAAPSGFPLVPWMLWFGWLWASLAWCDGGFRNVQDAMQLSMPLAVGVLASMFVRSPQQLRQLFAMFWPALLMLTAVVAAHKLGVLAAVGLNCAERSLSLTAVLIGCVAISAYPPHKLWPLASWGLCVLLTAATGSRMATFALLLAPAMHPQYRSKLWNVAILAVLFVMGVGLFYSPVFQRRFFDTGSGTFADVLDGQFLSFGRLEYWPAIWDEAWRHPRLGAGVGSTFGYVPTVWEGMNHVHNDYLRIFFEVGYIGLAIFVSVVLWQLFSIACKLGDGSDIERRAWRAVFMGLMLLLVTSCSDNTLIYNLWYTDPLFALLGAAYGVRQARLDQTRLGPTTATGVLGHRS